MRGKEDIAVVRGSGNAFRDLGRITADADQFKAILAPRLSKPLTGNASRCEGRRRGPASRRPIFLAFAMPILDASRLTGSSQCSTASGLVSR